MQNTVFFRILIKLAFLYLSFVHITGCSTGSQKKCSIIEIVAPSDVISEKNIVQFCEDYKVECERIFNWNNHWVIYINTERAEEIENRLGESFPEQEIKTFKTPFYHFNRKEDCGKEMVVYQDHVIMTASLVENEEMQVEYMQFHHTQREEWSEVAEGFCNADFQHVKVYRNGRQLMLVISIPKGKSLEELNPKTVENNPRVEEWNSIMSIYQEGIEDAPEGVTWIEFKKI